MNERIRELKRVAEDFYIGFPDSIYNDKVDEKFAELIVKECSLVCEMNPQFDNSQLANLIKLHFRVEE